MEKIRIKNLRSLEDTGFISLKPLVVLLGKNSSGKSTFLRTFPLLKQSILTPITEPILWYSEKSVDFGDFGTSINKNKKSSEESITFDFNFNSNVHNYYFNRALPKSKRSINFSLHVEISKKNFEKITIEVSNQKFEIATLKHDSDDYKISINNKELDVKLKQSLNHTFYSQNFLPLFLPKLAEKNKEDSNSFRFSNNTFLKFVSSEIKKLITPYYKKTIEENEDEYQRIIKLGIEEKFDEELTEEINDFISDLKMNNLEEVSNQDYSFYAKLKKYYYQKFKKEIPFEITEEEIYHNINFVRSLETAPDDVKESINLLFLLTYWSQISDICNEYLTGFFGNVHYIAPIRASAQRYYRTQGLAIEDIDPQGENIPMLINNMSPDEEMKFRNWTKINFEFEIFTREEGGHVSLRIKFTNGDEMNLTDTGFGFSQILPIILLIWKSNNDYFNERNNSRLNYDSTIVIEQPELHLHPHLQARLCEVLVKCVTYNNRKPRIIIETHSETIINKLGQLIFEEQLKADQVNVIAFGLSTENDSNSIKNIPFDNDGLLKEWPADFLMEDF